jgi:ketosteroid isomerase-like protein
MEADRLFFNALLAADTSALDALLADDFLLIDVLRGAEITKNDLIGAVAMNLVRFEKIEAHDPRVREYGDTAIVTGWTEMRMEFGGQSADVRSRYTHVFVRQEGGWRFVSAQGTPIAS